MIQPDCTLTAEEVFTEFTIKCLESDQFNVLSLAPNTIFEPAESDVMRLVSNTSKLSVFNDNPQFQSSALSLPSWVPDLSLQGQLDSFRELVSSWEIVQRRCQQTASSQRQAPPFAWDVDRHRSGRLAITA